MDILFFIATLALVGASIVAIGLFGEWSGKRNEVLKEVEDE